MTTQGSDDWLKSRLGFITASNLKLVLSKPKVPGELSKGAEAYLTSLMAEHSPDYDWEAAHKARFHNEAMDHGNATEPTARLIYEERQDVKVEQVGFIPSPTERLVGGSPDGLVGSDGGVEFKCPEVLAIHEKYLAYITKKQIYPAHRHQIQGLLWITERKWWDWVTFHEGLTGKKRLGILRVKRDEKYIKDLAKKVGVFRKLLCDRLEQETGELF